MLKRSLNNFFLLFFLFPFIGAANVVSPFNKLSFQAADSFSIIVTGHIHGQSDNISGYPASTILANIEELNSIKADAFFSLGDLFLELNEDQVIKYDKALFSRLQMPFFNVVGNHDIGRGLYTKTYGQTFSSFIVGRWAFILLDTEMNDGSLKEEQLRMIRDLQIKDLAGVFIFSHRPVWAEDSERYKNVFLDNTKSEWKANNFKKEVAPLLKSFTAMGKQVFWFSGSLGSAPASFFYDQDPSTRIQYLATAIRNIPRDAVLLLNVKSDKVTFDAYSLTLQKLKAVKEYDLDFWESSRPEGQGFNYRMTPYLTGLMLKHYFFWWGFFIGVFLIVTLCLWLKRR